MDKYKSISKSQVKALYRKKLRPRIKRLEKHRIKAKNKIISLAITYIVVMALLLYLTKDFLNLQKMPPVFYIILLVFLTALAIAATRRITKSYRIRFKQTIIKEMFDLFLNDSKFDPKSHISSKTFDHSLVTDRSYNRYKGEDLVKGQLGKIPIEFSELNVKKVTGSGKNKKVDRIFTGLFFRCEFNKNISTPLIIQSDNLERTFGRNISRFIQKKGFNGHQLVQLESSEFEKHFAVYSNDQILARVILNPLTMDRLNHFLKKYKEKFEITIVDHYLYFVIHSKKNHFEPKLLSQSIRWKDIMELYDLLTIIGEFTDQFNLNKRIYEDSGSS